MITISQAKPGMMVSELDRGKLYALYQGETPEAAALKFQRTYGRFPERIVVVGDWLYIEYGPWQGELP